MTAHVIHASPSPILGDQIAVGAVMVGPDGAQRVVCRKLPPAMAKPLARALLELERMAADADPIGWPINHGRCLTVEPFGAPAAVVLQALGGAQ